MERVSTRRSGESAAATLLGIGLSTALAAGLAVLGMLGMASAASAAEARSRAAVDVVFVIDTTGSMSGLLEAAKQRVWAIANEIAKGRPAPRIRLGLIAYRDRGDEYVSKVVDLSENLDAMYKELLGLQAGGGGDGPEHVLQGLRDAVERISWSPDRRTLKTVYLVGDAPPHFDYGDTPGLEALLQAALRKDVLVNAVQCGGDPATTREWTRIARLGEGRFLALPQDGGVAAVSTPHDERLARLSGELESTTLAYGSRRREADAAVAMGAALASAAPAPAAADRAVFKAARGFDGGLDLAQAAAEGKVELSRLKEDELPAALRGLKPAEIEKRLAEARSRRAGLQREIARVSQERDRYLKANAPTGRKDGFDAALVSTLKEQAARKGIAY